MRVCLCLVLPLFLRAMTECSFLPSSYSNLPIPLHPLYSLFSLTAYSLYSLSTPILSALSLLLFSPLSLFSLLLLSPLFLFSLLLFSLLSLFSVYSVFQDDYYLNLVDWSSTNFLSVALGNSVYLWSASNLKVTILYYFKLSLS